MSLTVALGTALSGLRVNQKSIETASHNVANAQTVGYSRQTVDRTSVAVGGQVSGVAIAGISRAGDTFVTAELRSQTAALGEAQVRDQFLSQLDQLFGQLDDSSTLGSDLATLSARAQALATDPADATRQSDLVAAAAAFATELNTMSGSVQSLRGQADQEIATTVASVNSDLARVAELNIEIARAQSSGESSADLQDQRDTVLARIGQSLDIRTFSRATGEVAVYMADGTALVDHSAAKLEFTPSAGGAYGTISVNGRSVEGGIGSGTLRGLLDLRDNVLPDMQAQIDTLAATARDRINAAHNRGTALPAPATLEGTRSFASVTGEYVTLSAPVRVAALDANGTIQAYADIPAGRYSVAELRDAINAALPGQVSATASDGSGLSLSATQAGYGVALVDMTADGSDMSIAYDNGGAISQHAGFSSFFGLNDLLVTPGVSGTAGAAGALTVRDDIAAAPQSLARGRLTTAAAPVAGTTTGVAAGDASVASAIDTAITTAGNIPAVGGLPASKTSLSGFASQIIASNASLAATAASAVEQRQATVDTLQARATSASGVSIDEEMANLIVFQNAYAASARVVSVVQQMFDTLNKMMG